jgi:hypothetical protein
MSDFQHKPGRFSLFKNDRREKETQPQYKGDGKMPDGTDVWVSAWLEEGKNGKYFSCSMQLKDEAHNQGVAQVKRDGIIPANSVPAGFADMEDDIPF